MATTRKSNETKQPVGEQEYLAALATFASKTNKADEITAALDVKITAMREAKAPQLKELKEAADEAFATVQRYCEENRDTLLPKDKKSFETQHGTIGFRTGTHSLKTLARKSWDEIVVALKAMRMKKYIRTVEEVDKDALIAARNTPSVADKFALIGIKVEQKEKFYIELKKEEKAA